MKPEQMSLFSARPGGPFSVPPGDFARPGLVDHGFVERSLAVMRGTPGAESELRRFKDECMASLRAISLLYKDQPNAWAVSTRERLFMEFFTTDEILRRLATPTQPRAEKAGGAPSA
jgi:hypothetical protein